MAYYISFFNTMDPNKGTVTPGSVSGTTVWPQWTAGKMLLEFGALGTGLLPDDFRMAQYDFIAANTAALHV